MRTLYVRRHTLRGPKRSNRPVPREMPMAAHEAAGAMFGAAVGSAVGMIGGPPGVVAGAVVGGAIGALAELGRQRGETDAVAHDAALDHDIGVVGGEIGAPGLEHPPATVGAYSSASAGGGSVRTSEAPAEGPTPPPEG